ncbi:SGNH/GDSL hydrolase family protein [Nocardia gipuzkoensis]|nr:diglucosylglycerate octanoyltransferase [Nocardia gipuzkoensis]MDE1673554.1 SGNH/GDSL hydrolase family protein [Nocardia gipuzkoensis]
MSSEDPIRSVPDELFRKVSAKAERQLPDALFGGPPPAAREPGATPEASPGAVAESGGSSDPSEESDAEDDGSAEVAADIATEAEPQVHVGGDTSPVDTANDAPGPIADSAEALEESVAADGSVVDESVTTAEEFTAALDESVASVADGPSADAIAASLVPSDAAVEPATVTTGPVESGEAELARTESVAAASESVAGDEPAGTEEAVRPVLLVIADSLSYFGPKGGLPADDPRIWPNLVAAELDWDVELVARIGWTCRDAYWALIGDPRVWAAVPRAGAVVFAVGGMDTLPSPLPTALRELIRYVRPPALRRAVRATYTWLQPKLSKLGRPVALPPKVSVDYLEQSRTALAQLRPELPVVAVLPSVHDCAAYGRVHSGRPRAVEALRAWSGRTSVPLVDLGEAVRDNIFSGAANPDGIHWGWDGHTAVANAMVKTLQEVR